eukprot:892985-Amphidinium_carterae.1
MHAHNVESEPKCDRGVGSIDRLHRAGVEAVSARSEGRHRRGRCDDETPDRRGNHPPERAEYMLPEECGNMPGEVC